LKAAQRIDHSAFVHRQQISREIAFVSVSFEYRAVVPTDEQPPVRQVEKRAVRCGLHAPRKHRTPENAVWQCPESQREQPRTPARSWTPAVDPPRVLRGIVSLNKPRTEGRVCDGSELHLWIVTTGGQLITADEWFAGWRRA